VDQHDWELAPNGVQDSAIFAHQSSFHRLFDKFACAIAELARADLSIEPRDQLRTCQRQLLMRFGAAQNLQQFGPDHVWAALVAASYTCFSGTFARSASCRYDSNSGAICTVLLSSRPIFTSTSPKGVRTRTTSRFNFRRSVVN